MQDPELSIEQAIMDYKRLGYSDVWISKRIQGTSKNSTFYEILSCDKRAFAWFVFGYVSCLL